jgi:DNA-binding LytR/AlgR family response regulator
MKILIVEDERIAAERLQQLVKMYDSTIEIVESLESVQSTVAYLNQYPHPDILLLDIYLSDGLSFEIFKQISYPKPVIFTTAYNQYALDAFKVHSIDYILKPVTQQALATAFNKYKNLNPAYSAAPYSHLLTHWPTREYKTRFLGKIGPNIFFVEAADIAFFEADNKIVHVVNTYGKRFIVDYTMEALEELLDPTVFYRANRSYLVKISSIHAIKPYYNNRLQLILNGAAPNTGIIIPREKVAEFKGWAEGKK